MKKRNLVLLALIIIVIMVCFVAFKLYSSNKIEVTSTVSEYQKFGNAVLNMPIEDFEAAGFCLGDSIDVIFENGSSLHDIPFYNGYYVPDRAPVLVKYPGYDRLFIALNNNSLWSEYNLNEGDGVTIRMNTAQKYAVTHEILGQSYSADRSDYDSDTQFCNFRAIAGGNLLENQFFRGASPVDDLRNRATYTNKLLEQYGIKTVIDLADSELDLAEFVVADDFQSDYALSINNEGRMILCDMGAAYASQEYKQKVAAAFRQLIDLPGPVYIHCLEGKDRTGFVCLLLLALADASYDELQADYMLTYKNYYGIDSDSSPDKYKAVSDLYFDNFLFYLHGTEDRELIKKLNYSEDVVRYLRDGGMTVEEVARLKERITK